MMFRGVGCERWRVKHGLTGRVAGSNGAATFIYYFTLKSLVLQRCCTWLACVHECGLGQEGPAPLSHFLQTQTFGNRSYALVAALALSVIACWGLHLHRAVILHGWCCSSCVCQVMACWCNLYCITLQATCLPAAVPCHITA
ncbi:hypothetical protein COO60DRAFT_1500704, partial [Scenedesmus sp. NREL 46B-D3]